MTGIEKQAAFYRAYLIDDRSLAPLTTAWAAIVGLWLIVYLVSAICGAEAKPRDGAGRGACVLPCAAAFPVMGRLAGAERRVSIFYVSQL